MQLAISQVNERHLKYVTCDTSSNQASFENPPTPPGSSGCEVPSGRHHLVPLTLGISAGMVIPPGPESLGPASTTFWVPGLDVCPCGTLFRLKTQFYPPKRPLRDAFLVQNTILSAQKAPAGCISSPKYNFIRPKGPCGTTFCYFPKPNI